jgi:hypothetical protein
VLDNIRVFLHYNKYFVYSSPLVGALHIAEVKFFPTGRLCYITVSSRHSTPRLTRTSTSPPAVAIGKIKRKDFARLSCIVSFSNLQTSKTATTKSGALDRSYIDVSTRVLHTSKRGKVPGFDRSPACRPSPQQTAAPLVLPAH